MRRVLCIYLLAYAALSMSAAARVAHADSEASVETHISGSSQMSVQVGNTVETSSSSGGTVEVHIETVEGGVKKTSEFRKELAPGETFRYATTTAVDTASADASVSVHAAAFIAATSSKARARNGAPASVAEDMPAEPRAPSRLLVVIQQVRAMLRSLFAWWR